MSIFGRGGTECPLLVGDPTPPRLSTEFEDWCEAQGIAPEAPDAWQLFERDR